jgi:hypothetical protein
LRQATSVPISEIIHALMLVRVPHHVKFEVLYIPFDAQNHVKCAF